MQAPNRTVLGSLFYSCTLLLVAVPLSAAEIFTVLWQKPGYLSATFSPDAKVILAGTQTGRVDVLDAATGNSKTSFQASASYIRNIEFAPNGELVAVASGERNFKIFRFTDLSVLHQQTTLAQFPPVSFSPDSASFAVGDKANITLYNSVSGGVIRSWSTTNFPLNDVQFMPDGKHVVTGSGQRGAAVALEMWDTATGERRWTERPAQTYNVESLAVSPDGQFIATCGYSGWAGQLQLWDALSGALKHTFSFNASSVSFSPQAPVLLAINTNLTLAKWPPEIVLNKPNAGSIAVRHQVRFNAAGTRFLTAGINLACYQTPRRFTHAEADGSALTLRWITPDANTTLQTSDLTQAWTDIFPDPASTSYTTPISGGAQFFRFRD
jgi:WD40 repeat protein